MDVNRHDPCLTAEQPSKAAVFFFNSFALLLPKQIQDIHFGYTSMYSMMSHRYFYFAAPILYQRIKGDPALAPGAKAILDADGSRSTRIQLNKICKHNVTYEYY